MRWFKHMTGTTNDEKISRLIDLGGMEAYGFYWRIIEIIATQMGKGSDKCEVTYSLPTLLRMTYSHHHRVGKHLGNVSVTGLIDVTRTEVNGEVLITLGCPNLLKYRDEWASRKSTTPEPLPSSSRVTPVEEIETETHTDAEADNKHAHSGKSGTRQRTKKLSDEELIESLKNNPAFQGIDIDREIGKMKAWLLTPKGRRRQLTRAFIVNWLNRIDRPVSSAIEPAAIIPVGRGRSPEQIQSEDQKYLESLGMKSRSAAQ